MRKYKRRMLISILALLIIGITVGYAILTSNLNLGGVTTIASNAWDIHFENLEKTTGSVIATKEAVIDEEKTSIYFEVPFEKPGDFYEFKVDIVNDGKIDAKLDDIIKTNLTAEQQNLINYTVRYEGGRALVIGDLLKANSRQKIIVRAEYKTSATDAVMEDMVLNLDINLKYVQDDGTGEELPVQGNLYQMVANNAVRDDVKSTYVTGDYGIDFKNISSDTNGKGVYTLTREMDGLYPVHYYRGDVTNNNVIFGGFCWKILRTTDTGGIKLVYNGTPTSGTCNGITSSTRLDNTSRTTLSLEDVGYMYDSSSNLNITDIYNDWRFLQNLSRSGMSLDGTKLYYGKTATYSNGVYTIIDGALHEWDKDYQKLNNYVTCFTTSNKCSGSIYSIYDITEDSASYAIINNGNTIEALKAEAEEKYYVFGDSITYNESNGKYALNNPKRVNYVDLNNSTITDNRYTCFTTSDSCADIYYIYSMYYYFDSWGIDKIHVNRMYSVKFQGGKTLDKILDNVVNSSNTISSPFKNIVDNWYKNNLLPYEGNLEDTIFCNDRSIAKYAGWKISGNFNSANNDMTFSAYERFKAGTPTLTCPINDSFSKTSIGNGRLTYPVGLITSDEAMYAGYKLYGEVHTFLTSNRPASELPNNDNIYSNFTMSPARVAGIYPEFFNINEDGWLTNHRVNVLYSFRPVVSLKGSTEYASGNGTSTSPYVIT